MCLLIFRTGRNRRVQTFIATKYAESTYLVAYSQNTPEMIRTILRGLPETATCDMLVSCVFFSGRIYQLHSHLTIRDALSND